MRNQLRDAWCGLRTAPGTTALALAILTLGIAAATVTFSIVDAVTLRRLPLPSPDRLMSISQVDRTSARPGTFLRLTANRASFAVTPVSN
jgi:hypothetical protein